MAFYKLTEDSYITVIGTGNGGIEISESEYNEIMNVIRNRPSAEGKGYRLRTDLTWEEYDLPPEPPPDPQEEISADELGQALEGIL